VRWSLTNSGSSTAYILRYQTPLFGIEADLFNISLDGERALYVGKLYKRPAPTAKDFLALAPGQTLTKVIELSSAYAMNRAGEYAVQYRADLAESLRPAKLAGDFDYSEEVLSNSIRLFREQGAGIVDDSHLLEENLPAGPSLVFRAQPASFVACSSSQQSALTSALSQAETYANNASSYLNAGTVGPRYTTWFGSYTSSRYTSVRNHFTNIKSTTASQSYTFHCDCTSSAYAYVYPTQPYNVWLCNAFWSAPLSGTDSKGGTLIHETSHFNVVAGTNDYAYGQTACRSLATSNPKKATNNADSHEYFAENNPAQN
ncbi:MAG TPA: M35 family metallo-endopeptidase, partial [Thermoanaerobaculia bacterium]|nr:M35 family metallo-endopeptidase [Thermoanaerobaculia bacterium]